MADVVAIGELLIDFTCVKTDPDGYPTMAAHPGGAPANFLSALSKFGTSTALIGKVGNDAFGKLLVDTLKKANIDVNGLIVDDTVFTTLAFVTLDEYGDREFSFARKPGADTRISSSEIDKRMIDAAKVFHFGTLSLTDEPSREATYDTVAYAKQKGKIITFDPNLRKPLWRNLEDAKEQMLWGLKQADVVKISDEEVEFLFGIAPEYGCDYIRKNFGAKLVFVTCGSKGCYFGNDQAKGFQPSLRNIQVVDTTGAGDIFGGSALWKLLQLDKSPDEVTEKELMDVVAFACASAGLSTTKPGGISSVPDKEQVLSVIDKGEGLC